MQTNAPPNSLDELLLPNWQEDDGFDPANTHYAHYTTAEAAVKIIRSGEIWLRNVRVMNDYLEVVYGLGLMANAWHSQAGETFKHLANSCFPGVIDILNQSLGMAQGTWPGLDHHIACFSIHDPVNDWRGRLSMWRAYGSVALVFRLSDEMLAAHEINPLGVHSWKVNYPDSTSTEAILEQAAHAIDQHRDFVLGCGQDKFMQAITQMIYTTAITTKHPGFAEEEEVRVYFRPSEKPDSALTRAGKIECINGLPQMIYPLSLQANPKHGNGLKGIDLRSILNRIIIGPTPYPKVMLDTFVGLLDSIGVVDAPNKVIVSDIPLR